MKKIILAASLFMAATAMKAQQDVGTWSVVPRIGVNLANMTNNDITMGITDGDVTLASKYKAGMKVGVDVEYQVAPQVAVSAGVFYSMQGCRYSDGSVYAGTLESEPTTKCYEGYCDFVYDNQYVTVPVLAHVYLAKNFAVKVGLQGGFLVKSRVKWSSQEYTVDNDGQRTYQSPQSHKQDDGAKKMDLAIPVGFSYEYENVILDARYNVGLTKADNFGARNNVFEFTVGYRFAL